MVRAENRLLAVGTLIEIFYSLAIVSGLEHVADVVLASGTQGIRIPSTVAGCGALMLALGDWAVYHVFVAHLGYRRIPRVILDLLIIIAIFFAFRCVEEPIHYAIAVLVYLVLGSSYILLLRIEHSIPPMAIHLSILQLGLAGVCGLMLWLLAAAHIPGNQATVVVASVCGLWGLVNLFVANTGLAKAENE